MRLSLLSRGMVVCSGNGSLWNFVAKTRAELDRFNKIDFDVFESIVKKIGGKLSLSNMTFYIFVSVI